MSCSGGACAPSGFMFQECISGNFNATDASIDTLVWTSDPGHYTQGTFQVFNSAASAAVVTGTVAGAQPATITADPGFTISSSVQGPTGFTIEAATGTSGTYCITLYKRVLA
ncbi:S-Ena type endospore appendage [Halalkalibacter sp. AB-rgal2]|uniref:S-Ena type endospore appendage n=1 Tax=Halalkalibacter sp. AB-rgal2 TaxID=3242695 RepID=UPI00359DE012